MSRLIVSWSLYRDPPSGSTSEFDYAEADIDLARVVAVMQGQFHNPREGGRSWCDAILVLDSGARLRSPINFDEARREWRERLEIARGEIAPPPWRGSR